MISISIITATYNASATIADCLRSISSQNHPAEHIIIDGASIDNTVKTVWEVSPDSKVFSEPDSGIYDAMNKGIALATGEVIGILNADDFYTSPDVLTQVARVFEDPEVMCCYGDLEYVKKYSKFYVQRSGHMNQGTGSEIQNSTLNTERRASNSFSVVRYWHSGTYSSRSFYRGWMPPHPAFFVRKSAYDRFGNFRLDLGSAADYELMLRFLLKQGLKCAYIPEVLVRMRVGGASNESLRARFKANRMDRRAWEVNGLKPYPWTLLCKPLRKVGQY